MKTKVYGVQRNGDAAAWTQRALEEAGIVNTEVGGLPVALVFHPKFHFVSAFDRRSSDGTAVHVTQIDPYGRLPDGRVLGRVPFSSQVFWMVWKRYFPETRLAI